jgi:hypothetical protein
MDCGGSDFNYYQIWKFAIFTRPFFSVRFTHVFITVKPTTCTISNATIATTSTKLRRSIRFYAKNVDPK